MYKKVENNMTKQEIAKKIIDKYNHKRQQMDAQVPLDGKPIERFENYKKFRTLRILNNHPSTYESEDYYTPYKNFVSLERELLMRKGY
jgi:hypothetical protein